MNGSAAFWVVASGIVLILVAAFAFARCVSPPQTSNSARTKQAAWIVASATSTCVLAGIAMAVADLGRAVTIVDVLALGISGIITGVVLTHGPAYRSRDYVRDNWNRCGAWAH